MREHKAVVTIKETNQRAWNEAKARFPELHPRRIAAYTIAIALEAYGLSKEEFEIDEIDLEDDD